MTQETFDLTSRMLHINPEFYTVWNYRRYIFVHAIFPKMYVSILFSPCIAHYTCSPPAEINALLSEDLNLTTVLLKQHPKVYWIWNHRRWCLANVPDGPSEDDKDGWRTANWSKELFVVEKMLDADARNCESSFTS